MRIMVKRGMLLILAGLFWCGGVAALYWHLDATTAFSTQRMAEINTKADHQFPFAIEGTDLVAIALTSYDGVYWEDGTVEEVSSIAAIILRNDGKEPLEKAQVSLWQGENELTFALEYLPAGEKIMVLEKERAPYRQEPITACAGSATVAPRDIPGLVTIRQTQGKYLLITNPGPIPLRDITLYYKTYDPERGMFLGGIAYEIAIYRIAPEETYIAEPGYYISGQSRIVKIKTSGT